MRAKDSESNWGLFFFRCLYDIIEIFVNDWRKGDSFLDSGPSSSLIFTFNFAAPHVEGTKKDCQRSTARLLLMLKLVDDGCHEPSWWMVLIRERESVSTKTLFPTGL
jgi:hypothetical protein